MQAAIGYIRKELHGIYPQPEIETFIFLIMEHLRGYSRTRFLLSQHETLSGEERLTVGEIVSRLKVWEPIQYIIGETDFYGLKFQCRPGALIPRPETEELVQWVLSSVKAGCRVLDLGTGTGCIPISVKKNAPEAVVYGCDISSVCLELSRSNALKNDADVCFFGMDILNPVFDKTLPVFDVLVSNPPYVTCNEKMQMEQNVLEYEPELALFVPDDDPLRFYKALIAVADVILCPGGLMFWEINEAFGPECVSLLQEAGYCRVTLRKDIHGRDRMVCAQKS